MILVVLIPGCGGKTTIAKTYKNCLDIDDFWDKSGEIEMKMTAEWEKALENNNTKIAEELEEKCVKQKALNLISHLSSSHFNPEVILCQSESQWDVLYDSYLKDSLKCLICVPAESFHTDLLRKRGDNVYIANICSKQRLNLLKCKLQPIQNYRDFSELFVLINKHQTLHLK